MDRDQIHTLAKLIGSGVQNRKGNVVIACPMAPLTHAKERGHLPRLSVKMSQTQPSVCLCFSCGMRGSVLRVFEEAEEALGIYAEAVAFIEEFDTGGLEGEFARLRSMRSAPVSEDKRRVFSDLARYVARCSRTVPKYLIDRGVVKADVDRWRIGYDTELRRAVFPVWDHEGHLVGASRRTVLSSDIQCRCMRCGRLTAEEAICCGEEMAHYPKYHDTHGLPKEDVFYGEHLVDTTREHVYLVEGILDVVFAARVLPNVLGLMGVNTGVGAARLTKLRRWCRTLTLIMDADQAGSEAVAGRQDHKGRYIPGLQARLRRHVVVRVATLPERQDPASVSPETLLETVENARYLCA